jgi:hypothetical protein
VVAVAVHVAAAAVVVVPMAAAAVVVVPMAAATGNSGEFHPVLSNDSRSCLGNSRMEKLMILFAGNASRERNRVGVGAIALLVLAICFGITPMAVAGQSTAQQPVLSGHESSVRRTPVHPVEAGQQTYSSAAEASEALASALQKEDEPSLVKVLGAKTKDVLSSGDEAEDKEHRAQFVQKYKQMHRLVSEPSGLTTLYIGAENWPTPIPLVQKGASWYFDTAAGEGEILYRRVGENELTVIQVCGELVDAQKEYQSQQHDGGTERQFAQTILSDQGKHNGLYWKVGSGGNVSPLGPLVASAEREGYAENAGQKPQPFHGYYFRVLKGQGTSAPGGSQSYVVDGKMTRGFAFLAYPAEYRSSGVMTFLVAQDGIVYEKDLGGKTDAVAKSIQRYDRDATWRKAD